MDAVELLRIGELFDSLRWSIQDDRDSQIPDLFERFARMWCRLDKGQRDLLFELTKSYAWIRKDEREKRFFAAWDKFVSQLPSSISTIAIVPLLKPGSTQPKSSSAMYYDFVEGYRAKLIGDLEPRKLMPFKSVGLFLKKLRSSPNVALVMIDDYVGSGDTALKAIGKIPNAENFSLYVLALAAQQSSAARLSDKKCQLIADLVITRGISDNKTLGQNETAKEIMNGIGAMLGIRKSERNGYGSSEALITLTRTPNNTFPIYWTNRKVQGAVWDSPFTRYTDNGS